MRAPRSGAGRILAEARALTAVEQLDLVVVGGGIVGLAAARALLEARPGASLALLEKEPGLAAHQSGRNSGVIHTGLYYRPGSLKARLCRAGRAALIDYCEARGIAHAVTGKVVVATHAEELTRLDALAERAAANGVEARRIEPQELAELEPHAAGLAALHVPAAGVVDYPAVCAALAVDLEASGARLVLGARVQGLRHESGAVVVESSAGEFRARELVNCAGLHSDRVARLAGAELDARIVPFRGEYWELTPEAQHLCRALVYPLPDPGFPFLGVHFTRGHDGVVECGPNAVLALAREGYRWRDLSPRDLAETLAWPGTRRLFARHARMGAGELWRSVSKRALVRALQRLIPAVQPEHLVRSPAGVRAQAIARDGSPLDDFVLERRGACLHVLNAPSPAATSALAIAEELAARL